MMFFFIRFLIFVFVTWLPIVYSNGFEFVEAHGFFVFAVVLMGIAGLIAYFLMLFFASVLMSMLSSSNQFPINFHTVAVADTIFCYGLIMMVSAFFLTETGLPISVNVAQGPLVVDGIKTPLGWQVSAQNAKSAIFCIIAIHALCLIHNFVATRRQPVANS
ncbi:hypothetical protein [Agrobacterium larrymoorei]|uniref:Uncharacterized protein n=1 Tax=Agrobacterium larrymoorei TaxID=160699 RepID=A0ABU0UG88_9HYPH|nr:hypothetical protein [Agrobacterium larrymoorei]MDQ1183937.1 hypothetical protein [Agrobacterium larrymoorei]